MDLCFTSVSLAEWALEKKVTIVGKMRHDRKGIPKELKEVKSREEKSVIFMQNDKNNIGLVHTLIEIWWKKCYRSDYNARYFKSNK